MKKILAYRFSAFGDVALVAPVLKEFLQQNTDVEIVMISQKRFFPLFKNIERLTFEGVELADYKGFTGLMKLAKIIDKKHKPDFVADLHFSMRTRGLNFYFWMKRKKIVRLIKGRKEKNVLVNVENSHKTQLKHACERYADVFRSFGYDVELSFQLPENQQHKHGIGFAPFAKHRGKMLPLEKSFELLKILAEKEKIYLFGGGEYEEMILAQWAENVPNTISLAANVPLEEELQRMAALRALISMDSANMHLASLVGTRCISVWCQTHRFAGFLGYGQSENDIVEVKNLTCRPCSVFGNKKECFRKDWACINNLNINEIVDKINS